MKRRFWIPPSFVSLLFGLWTVRDREPDWPDSANIDEPPRAGSVQDSLPSPPPTLAHPLLSAQDAAWIDSHSAGLILSQAMDPVSQEPTGTVLSADGITDLGETPPFFRFQLLTSAYPLLLGDKHQRQSFEIYATSLIPSAETTKKAWPLWVRYPRPAGLKEGLETSGGFVFVRGETPLHRIGVLVPKVIPVEGQSPNDFEWQIQIRVNDRLDPNDYETGAKPQSLGSDMVVLMATHPEKLPASSWVVWFRFENDGTVSLLTE